MNEDSLLFRSGTRYLLWLEHIDALYQGADDFRIQFFDLGVLFDLREERVDVETLRLGLGDGITQDNYPCREVFLLLLIGGSHLGETLITDFPVEVILVESLDDAVQFGNALCGLLQLTATFTKLFVEVTLVFLGEQFHKLRFPFTHKDEHPIYLGQQNLFHLHIVYLVRGAFSFLLAVGSTYEILLLVRPPSGTNLIQFCTAVGTEQHPGQDRHFAHRREPASAITDILDDVKGFLEIGRAHV